MTRGGAVFSISNSRYEFAFPRHSAPESCQKLPALLKSEGAGNAGCALHPRSHVRFAQNKMHMSIQGSGEHPTFPAQWLYGLYRALPGDEFLVDSVAAGQLLALRQLDACHGRQDHTLLPYAAVALRLRDLSVHRNPPNVRDDGRRPLSGTGWANICT